MGEDFHQRQPLLPQGDTQEEEEQLTLLTLSPRVIRYRLSLYGTEVTRYEPTS